MILTLPALNLTPLQYYNKFCCQLILDLAAFYNSYNFPEEVGQGVLLGGFYH